MVSCRSFLLTGSLRSLVLSGSSMVDRRRPRLMAHVHLQDSYCTRAQFKLLTFTMSVTIFLIPPVARRYLQTLLLDTSLLLHLTFSLNNIRKPPDLWIVICEDGGRSVLLHLKNPTFLFLCSAGATEANLIAGMSTFGPKFLESQFSLSASDAATWFGFIVVTAGGGGTFLGGYIVKKLNLRCRGIIRFCMISALVSLLATFIFLVHCPNVPMAGVTAPYRSGDAEKHQLDRYNHLYDKPSKLHVTNSSSLEENLTVNCNAGCGCVRELYNPVCGADGMMYYSPCHAGCTFINHTEWSTCKQVYSRCSCVVSNASWGEEGFALAGKCSSTCHHMPAFLSFLFIVIIFTFLCSIPALTATLRCVSDSQRSFGLGIQLMVVRTLGSIPGPISFGSVIDVSCLLWQDQCGEQGSLMAGIIYKVLGALFFLIASIMYKTPLESPHSSWESTDHRPGEMSDLPVKDLATDGVIIIPHAKL